MNQGDIVTIKWPGDTVAVKVPEWVKPGETVLKLRLGELLEIIEQPRRDESVPVVAVTDPNYPRSEPNAGPLTRAIYKGPPQFIKAVACNKCGEPIFLYRSGRTGKFYGCSTQDPKDFHSKVCADNVKRNGTSIANPAIAGGTT